MDTHTRCWKKYNVRPDRNAEHPEYTNSEYCIYDQPNKTYLYTEDWVDFLIDEMDNDENYDILYE